MREIDVQRALSSYHKLIELEKKYLQQYEYFQTKLVGKVSSSMIVRSECNTNNEQQKLGWIDKKCKVEKKLKDTQDELITVRDFLQFLPTKYEEPIVPRQLIKDMYIDFKPKDKIEVEYGYSIRTVYNHINKSIEEFVNAN